MLYQFIANVTSVPTTHLATSQLIFRRNGGILTAMVDYTIICNIKTVMLPLYHIFIDK